MNYKLIISIITIIFLNVLQLGAQENYIPGKVITLSSDTVSGFIDYREWVRSPQKIGFKATLEGEKIWYNPLSCAGFVVADEVYRSAVVDREMSPQNTADLTYDSELRMALDTAFLLLLVDGDKSLYINNTAIGKSLFYVLQNGKYELLIFKRYLDANEASTTIKENNRFLGQLAYYLQDCAKIQSLLKNTDYTSKSIVDVFSEYHKCIGAAYKARKIADGPQKVWGILAGASMTKVNMGGEDFPHLSNQEFPSSILPSGGVYFELIFPRGLQKWSLVNELVYWGFKFDGSYTDYVHSEHYTETNFDFYQGSLKLNSMIRFRQPVKQTFIYFNTGIFLSKRIHGTNEITRRLVFFNSETISADEVIPGVGKLSFGFVAGTGVKFGKFNFNLHIESAADMDNLINLSTTSLAGIVYLGYEF